MHSSVIEGEGFREFAAGYVVEFGVEQVKQHSFDYRGTRAVFVRDGPAPTLRRVGGRVVIAEQGAPHTALLPHRSGPAE